MNKAGFFNKLFHESNDIIQNANSKYHNEKGYDNRSVNLSLAENPLKWYARSTFKIYYFKQLRFEFYK